MIIGKTRFFLYGKRVQSLNNLQSEANKTSTKLINSQAPLEKTSEKHTKAVTDQNTPLEVSREENNKKYIEKDSIEQSTIE